MTNIGLNIGLYLRKSKVIATDFRPKKEQRESAYVSRKRMWRTLPEPSSNCRRGSKRMPNVGMSEHVGSSVLPYTSTRLVFKKIRRS